MRRRAVYCVLQLAEAVMAGTAGTRVELGGLDEIRTTRQRAEARFERPVKDAQFFVGTNGVAALGLSFLVKDLPASAVAKAPAWPWGGPAEGMWLAFVLAIMGYTFFVSNRDGSLDKLDESGELPKLTLIQLYLPRTFLGLSIFVQGMSVMQIGRILG
jgi:hypothetical protein